MAQPVTSVVFDLGGVLIDWDPRYLYRKLFAGDEKKVEWFLANICTPAWNHRQDEGRSFAEAEAELIAKHPAEGDAIRAWRLRFDEMMAGEIPGSVAILAELRQRNVPLYALTNWSSEVFPLALKRFAFLGWFKGITVSGQELCAKPDPRLYRIMVERYNLDPAATLFIDDRKINVEAAEKLGFSTVLFTGAADLKHRLETFGFLQPARNPKQGTAHADARPRRTR